MLSGFLMATVYRRQIADGTIPLSDYLLHRLHKLYPIYLLTNAISLFTDILRYGLSAVNIQRIALVVLLQSGGGLESTETYNAPTWFLSALLLCYLIFYAIAYYGKSSNQYVLLIVFTTFWGYTLVMKDWSFPFCYGITGLALLNFFVGCLIAEGYPKMHLQAHTALVAASMCTLAVSFALMMQFGVDIICGDSRIAFSLVLCPAILYLALDSKILGTFLCWAPTQYLGKLSVPIYFWHLVIFDLYCYFATPSHGLGDLFEAQYAGYFLITLMWCTLCQKWSSRNLPIIRKS